MAVFLIFQLSMRRTCYTSLVRQTVVGTVRFAFGEGSGSQVSIQAGPFAFYADKGVHGRVKNERKAQEKLSGTRKGRDALSK